jgi:hypothetical protein
MALATVVAGSTRRPLVVTIVDENGNIIPLHATATNHRLQGHSRDLGSSKKIDVVADNVNGPAGIITFNGVGTRVAAADLATANLKSTTYRLEVKFADTAGTPLIDYTPSFEITFEAPPDANIWAT